MHNRLFKQIGAIMAVALMFVLVFAPTGLVYAQQPPTIEGLRAQIEALHAQLIMLLQAKIAILQEQIAALRGVRPDQPPRLPVVIPTPAPIARPILTPTPAPFDADPLLAARIADSRRLGDLSAIRSALAMYMVESPSPILNRRGICSPAHPFLARAPVGAGRWTWVTINANQGVDGDGWIPVDLRGLPGGSPLLTFPVDPINTGNRFYVYGCQAGARGAGFALVANLESAEHSQTEAQDRGVCPDLYEIGTIVPFFSRDQLRELFGTC